MTWPGLNYTEVSQSDSCCLFDFALPSVFPYCIPLNLIHIGIRGSEDGLIQEFPLHFFSLTRTQLQPRPPHQSRSRLTLPLILLRFHHNCPTGKKKSEDQRNRIFQIVIPLKLYCAYYIAMWVNSELKLKIMTPLTTECLKRLASSMWRFDHIVDKKRCLWRIITTRCVHYGDMGGMRRRFKFRYSRQKSSILQGLHMKYIQHSYSVWPQRFLSAAFPLVWHFVRRRGRRTGLAMQNECSSKTQLNFILLNYEGIGYCKKCVPSPVLYSSVLYTVFEAI